MFYSCAAEERRAQEQADTARMHAAANEQVPVHGEW